MAQLLNAALLGDALSMRSREQLARWLEACETNGQRLRANLPADWRRGSKTGGGGRGSTNDVGIFWPPGRPPLLVAVYVTHTRSRTGTARSPPWRARSLLRPSGAGVAAHFLGSSPQPLWLSHRCGPAS